MGSGHSGCLFLESVFCFQQITTTRTTTVRVSPLLPPPTLAPRCWVCVSSSSREPRWDAPCLIVVGLRQIQQGQRCWGVPQSDFRCYLPCSSGDRSSSSKWHERKKENKKNTSILRVIDRYRCPSCFFVARGYSSSTSSSSPTTTSTTTSTAVSKAPHNFLFSSLLIYGGRLIDSSRVMCNDRKRERGREESMCVYVRMCLCVSEKVGCKGGLGKATLKI